MSGTRFARTGRCRFFIGFCVLIVMIGMVAIFHSSQQELDAVKYGVTQCKSNMEVLRKRWQVTMEQKFEIEKAKEQELSEHLSKKESLEQQLKEQTEQLGKVQTDSRVNLEKLQHAHKLLQSEHAELVSECAKSKKQQLDDANSLEKKLQSLRSELQKAKSLQESEIALWKEKYNTIVREKTRLEALLNAADIKLEQEKHIKELESIIAEYGAKCAYKPTLKLDSLQQQQQINNPLNSPETTNIARLPGSGIALPSFDKPQSQKFFNEQESVSPGLYHIAIKVVNQTQKANNYSTTFDSNNSNIKIKKSTEKADVETLALASNGEGTLSKKLEELKQLPFSAQNNRSLIINSVENFQIVPKPLKKLSEEIQETQLKQQTGENPNIAIGEPPKISPLSAPRKNTSTQSTKFEQRVLQDDGHVKSIGNISTSSSTSLPPLPLPRKQLPAMVAPIPEFDQLLKNEAKQVSKEKTLGNIVGSVSGGNAAAAPDIDAAIEDTQRQDGNDDGTNNRYANVVNDMEAKSSQKKSKSAKLVAAAAGDNVIDSGAHEIKDHELANEPNFNVPAEEDDNNFFDGGVGGGEKHADAVNNVADDGNKHKDEIDDDDDMGLGGIGAGDIAVKNQHLLEADSLNNEVAGDQGKEFPDGLRLEDANEEDEDEDEYANPAARQQGAQAIRN